MGGLNNQSWPTNSIYPMLHEWEEGGGGIIDLPFCLAYMKIYL
jgi:hypothetical protein